MNGLSRLFFLHHVIYAEYMKKVSFWAGRALQKIAKNFVFVWLHVGKLLAYLKNYWHIPKFRIRFQKMISLPFFGHRPIGNRLFFLEAWHFKSNKNPTTPQPLKSDHPFKSCDHFKCTFPHIFGIFCRLHLLISDVFVHISAQFSSNYQVLKNLKN